MPESMEVFKSYMEIYGDISEGHRGQLKEIPIG